MEIKYTSTNASGERVTLDAVEVAGELTYTVPMITSVTPNTGYTLGGDSVVSVPARSRRRGFRCYVWEHARDHHLQLSHSDRRGHSRSCGRPRPRPSVHVGGHYHRHPRYASRTCPRRADYHLSFPQYRLHRRRYFGIGAITGTNFAGLSGSSAVTFGGVDAKSYVRVSATTITAVAPVHTAGTARVEVTAFGGTAADTDKDDFTYTETPPVTRYDRLQRENR